MAPRQTEYQQGQHTAGAAKGSYKAGNGKAQQKPPHREEHRQAPADQ